MKKQRICTHCFMVENGTTPKSLCIEIILWCAFIIPGLVYSIWQLKKNGVRCRACGEDSMIPTNTPRGEKLLSQTMAAE